MDPQNNTFENIRSKVLTLLKISEVPAKERYLQKSCNCCSLYIYKLFILPKIPFNIILKIVEMPLNVEYPTLPLNKHVTF